MISILTPSPDKCSLSHRRVQDAPWCQSHLGRRVWRHGSWTSGKYIDPSTLIHQTRHSQPVGVVVPRPVSDDHCHQPSEERTEKRSSSNLVRYNKRHTNESPCLECPFRLELFSNKRRKTTFFSVYVFRYNSFTHRNTKIHSVCWNNDVLKRSGGFSERR